MVISFIACLAVVALAQGQPEGEAPPVDTLAMPIDSSLSPQTAVDSSPIPAATSQGLDTASVLPVIPSAVRDSAINMQKTVVKGKSRTQAVRRQAFNVNAIDASKSKDRNLDVNQLLNKSTGVIVREEGGLGSGFDLSLAGLSGKQVKFFLDGIPMENMGRAMTLNNFPANTIETIEVYKGVVPIHLGSDALGGAVDVKTKSTYRDYLDASYAFGSFNTHRLSINSQAALDSSSVLLRLNSYFNHSDNDFPVEVSLVDTATGRYGAPRQVERFHDAYRSWWLNAEAGVYKKAFADQLLLGLSYGENKDDIQHAVSLDRVFGKVFSSGRSALASLKFRKDGLFLPGLSANAYVSGGLVEHQVVDTSNRQYNWLGGYTVRNNHSIGEALWEKTLLTFTDETLLGNASLTYDFASNHQIAANVTASYLERKGKDPIATGYVPFSDPNSIHKQVAGLAYKLDLFNRVWSTTVFGKLYHLDVLSIGRDWPGQPSYTVTHDALEPGYGLATTYFPVKPLQIKVSYENALRIPEAYELFGDGLLLRRNAELRPERSHNANFGLLYMQAFSGFRLNAEANLFYRDVTEMIRLESEAVTARYLNQENVNVTGGEGEVSLEIGRRLETGINATWQDIINTTEFESTGRSYVYLDRIPNIPYFFANTFMNVHWPKPLGIGGRVTASWNGRFVEEFYLKWPSLGDPGRKHVIPSQFVNSLGLVYGDPTERYSLALEGQNLADAKVYDNFRLQKPGRTYSAKIRVSL